MGLIARALALLGLPREKRDRVIEGMTVAQHDAVVGEAGPEVIAILRNPRERVDASSFGPRSRTYADRGRCESRRFDGKGRSWRCVRAAGHPPSETDGGHAASERAGRHW